MWNLLHIISSEREKPIFTIFLTAKSYTNIQTYWVSQSTVSPQYWRFECTSCPQESRIVQHQLWVPCTVPAFFQYTPLCCGTTRQLFRYCCAEFFWPIIHINLLNYKRDWRFQLSINSHEVSSHKHTLIHV